VDHAGQEPEAPTPRTWVPGAVPEEIGPPPSLDDLPDDVVPTWVPARGEPAEDVAVPTTRPGLGDLTALAAVVAAALGVALGAMAPAGRRLSELPDAAVADPGVVPALVALGCVLLLGVGCFAVVLTRGVRPTRVGAGPGRYRVLAWTWAALAVVVASARVTGTFAVFGDPLDGAIEHSPSGHLLGVAVPKAAAVGVIWSCLYGLVVVPAIALLFVRLEARGKLDREVVLTRSGPVIRPTRSTDTH